jgi:nitroreductase / dihydropteridine reductase
VVECTHLLIFSAINNPQLAIDRVVTAHDLDGTNPSYAKSLRKTFLPMTTDQFFHYSSNQAHIALGFSLAAAADLNIVSCPMGGFQPEKVRDVLNLPQSELPVAYLAVGKRLEGEDGEKLMNPFPKLRLSLPEMIKYY